MIHTYEYIHTFRAGAWGKTSKAVVLGVEGASNEEIL